MNHDEIYDWCLKQNQMAALRREVEAMRPVYANYRVDRKKEKPKAHEGCLWIRRHCEMLGAGEWEFLGKYNLDLCAATSDMYLDEGYETKILLEIGRFRKSRKGL